MSAEADIATIQHRVLVLERERSEDRKDLRRNTETVLKLTTELESTNVKLDGMAKDMSRVVSAIDGNGKPGLFTRVQLVENGQSRASRIFWAILTPILALMGVGIWALITERI